MSSCHPGDLGTRVIAQQHSYCTTLTGQGKRDCQSAKQGVQGQQQLEAGPSSVCSSEESLSSHSGGSFRRSSETPVGPILELASRSPCRGGGCTDHSVECHDSVCVSSAQTGSSNSEESPGREVRVFAGSSSMGAATMVFSPVTDVNGSTCSDTNVSRSVKSSRWVSPSFVREQSSGAGGMASVRKSHRTSGL